MANQPPMKMLIHKLDADGKELLCYEGFLLEQSETLITLEAQFDRDDIDIEDLQLRRGDRFVETFYFDRWYNVFAVHQEGTNKFKGWYCNISRPAWQDGNHLYAEDLALDLIVLPDRRMKVVDQFEFDNLTIPAADRIKARDALDELIDFAGNAVGLFKPIISTNHPDQHSHP